MKKVVMVFLPLLLSAQDIEVMKLPQIGIEVEHILDGEKKKVVIERSKPLECYDIRMSPEDIFGGSLAGKHIPKACKIEIVTTAGSIQPMSIDKEIKTIGELEVMEMILRAKKEPKMYALVDTRKSEWYEQMTIPSAINVQYTDIEYDPLMEEDYYAALAKLGVSKKDNGLDFSGAKSIVAFCTGVLCVQSKRFIQNLTKLGYPKEKLAWYRGGVQDWVSVGMSVVRAEKKKK